MLSVFEKPIIRPPCEINNKLLLNACINVSAAHLEEIDEKYPFWGYFKHHFEGVKHVFFFKASFPLMFKRRHASQKICPHASAKQNILQADLRSLSCLRRYDLTFHPESICSMLEFGLGSEYQPHPTSGRFPNQSAGQRGAGQTSTR